MHKQIIISAIQSQQMIRINFQKETTGEFVTRDIAPYDIFPKKKKNHYHEEDFLLGYADIHVPHGAHVVSTYLSNISSVEVLKESFDGREITRLVNPKEPPVIPRNW
ncbi:MAG: hypothetical protein HZA80_03225 [Candidatus Taylorbacteria bacterium]|nr:hypothetical protein [Candidatus Taylorbacteria bacterium]